MSCGTVEFVFYFSFIDFVVVLYWPLNKPTFSLAARAFALCWLRPRPK
jgi:hypothetical protein